MTYKLSFLKKTIGIALISLLAASNICLANNGGVHGPNVKADTRQLDFRTAQTAAHDGLNHKAAYRLHYQHALNDSFRLRFVSQYRDINDLEFDFVKAELLYNYQKTTASGYSAGVRFDLRARRGERPEDFAVHWTHQWNLNNNLQARAILILGKNLNGDGDKPVTLGTRFGLSKAIDEGMRVGLELFDVYGAIDDVNSFQDQRHQIGPTFSIKRGKWMGFARYLNGLSSASDEHNFSFRVIRNF